MTEPEMQAQIKTIQQEHNDIVETLVGQRDQANNGIVKLEAMFKALRRAGEEKDKKIAELEGKLAAAEKMAPLPPKPAKDAEDAQIIPPVANGHDEAPRASA